MVIRAALLSKGPGHFEDSLPVFTPSNGGDAGTLIHLLERGYLASAALKAAGRARFASPKSAQQLAEADAAGEGLRRSAWPDGMCENTWSAAWSRRAARFEAARLPQMLSVVS